MEGPTRESDTKRSGCLHGEYPLLSGLNPDNWFRKITCNNIRRAIDFLFRAGAGLLGAKLFKRRQNDPVGGSNVLLVPRSLIDSFLDLYNCRVDRLVNGRDGPGLRA